MKISKTQHEGIEKHITVVTSGRTLELIEIECFLEKYSITLPNAFKHFYCRNNPILIKESIFKKEYYINAFYPIDPSIILNIEDHHLKFNEYYQNKYLAFADDPGGWEFVLCIKNNLNFGKVYFCRMDEELDNALTFLADNFEEFINGLHSEENDVK